MRRLPHAGSITRHSRRNRRCWYEWPEPRAAGGPPEGGPCPRLRDLGLPLRPQRYQDRRAAEQPRPPRRVGGALADGLLQEHGLLDDYRELQDERKRFLAQPENAEYAQFYTWRKEVNDYDGGVEKYWQDAIKGGNESARLYYEDVMSQPLTYEQRHQRLTSMYGFMQLKGYHTSVWDPAPVQMHGVFDPVNVANQAPQPIPYEEPNA